MVQTFPDGSDIYEATGTTNHEQEPLGLALPELSEAALAADWLALIEQHSQLAIALLELKPALSDSASPYSVRFATAAFGRLLADQAADQAAAGDLASLDLTSLLEPLPNSTVQQRLRLIILNSILQDCYGAAAAIDQRLLQAPILVPLPGSQIAPMRSLELRLVSARPLVQGVSDSLRQRLAACWQTPPCGQAILAQLFTEGSPLAQLLQDLRPSDYEISGYVLLEGQEVTERELASALVQLLVSRESLLEPQKFGRANALMKQLFRADGSLILSAENNHVKLFTELDQPEWRVQTYPVQMLQASFFKDASQVLNIPDLGLSCVTDFDRQILASGVRSLLIIPLVAKSTTFSSESRHLLGLVGLTSSQPYAFNQGDCAQAAQLIPALTAALRHTVQDRFTSIHSSVRWRFEQEAERRSWGLPPEPIVFENVYPLYGISDVRGSSEERNRAIQADLLSQFRLAQGVMDAVCNASDNAFARQFRVDLAEHIATLTAGITVEAEVTLLRYLQDTLEAHFDFFAACSPAAAEAVAAYRSALDPEQGCVYAARAIYDQTINRINQLLKDTWSQCQQALQGITRHYCDVEATDGIDHMIYAGRSIDPGFTAFHLRSLRYEQLRAVCACARAAFSLKDCGYPKLQVTHLVLVQAATVDITHDEATERLFDVRGTRDTRYEIVKKRIDKACDSLTRDRITQPGMLTVVYSTEEEWQEYQQYLRYLHREGWVEAAIDQGTVEPLQGVSGLKFGRVRVLPQAAQEPPES